MCAGLELDPPVLESQLCAVLGMVFEVSELQFAYQQHRDHQQNLSLQSMGDLTEIKPGKVRVAGTPEMLRRSGYYCSHSK